MTMLRLKRTGSTCPTPSRPALAHCTCWSLNACVTFPVMQSLSWTDGLLGVVTRPRLNAPAPHPCYVALCTVKEVEDMLVRYEISTAAAALTCYRGVCERALSQFCGWKLTLGAEHRGDKSRLLYAFHELSDALAWAINTQHALLHAAWPDALNSSPASQTIYHRDEDRQWRELFAGLRVAIAVSQHTITLRSCLVRIPRLPPFPGSSMRRRRPSRHSGDSWHALTSCVVAGAGVGSEQRRPS